MNNGKVDWRGSYVAIVTPFTANGDIDRASFISNIEFLLEGGADGFVVSGCTGESWALTAAERLELYRTAVEVVGDRGPVIAGTGGVSTQGVIDLSIAAKEAGTAGLLVLPPYYCMLNPREVVEHYRQISDHAQHPIMLYNMPRRTGINLSPALLDEIVDLEYAVAIKESSNDFIQTEATIATVGDRITVFTGHSAERAIPALLMGAKGFVSSMESQVMGREAIQMFDLFQSGKLDQARAVQMRTLSLDQQMKGAGTFPANLKTAMNLLGRTGGFPRRPLLPLTTAETDRVRGVLESLGIAPVMA